MLDFLAEKKIQEAMACGEFDDLPGAGRPLDLDDDALVPEELRLAKRATTRERWRGSRARRVGPGPIS